MIHKVLWVDDQHDILESYPEEAARFGLDLEGVSNSYDACRIIEENHRMYSAVVLDGIFFKESSDAQLLSQDLNRTPLVQVLKALSGIESSYYLPTFVLSGEKRILEEGGEFLDGFGIKRVYHKNDTDRKHLWSDVKNAIESRPNVMVRMKYRQLFDLADSRAFSIGFSDLLFSICQCAEGIYKGNKSDIFNIVRKALESAFAFLKQGGLIPSEIFDQKGWINGCSMVLAGKHSDFEINSEIIPGPIRIMMYPMTNLAQDGSHEVAEKLGTKVTEYIASYPNSLLPRLLSIQFLEFFNWVNCFNNEMHSAKWKPPLYHSKRSNEEEVWLNAEVVDFRKSFVYLKVEGHQEVISAPERVVKGYKMLDKLQIRMNQIDQDKYHIIDTRGRAN